MKDPIAKRAPFLQVSDLGANRYLKKLEARSGLSDRRDKKILPGLSWSSPRGTPGMQAVVVNTAKERPLSVRMSPISSSAIGTTFPARSYRHEGVDEKL